MSHSPVSNVKWPACLDAGASWLRPGVAGCAVLDIQVIPNAPRTRVDGLHGNAGNQALKVRLNALPIDGKANDALVKWLAEVLGIAQRSIAITRGQTSRRKQVQVSADAAAQASWDRLISLSGKPGPR